MSSANGPRRLLTEILGMSSVGLGQVEQGLDSTLIYQGGGEGADESVRAIPITNGRGEGKPNTHSPDDPESPRSSS